MTRRQMFKIVDQRTGQRMGVGSYPKAEWAWQEITEWQNRHDRGGRPDITRDMLVNMIVVEEDGLG